MEAGGSSEFRANDQWMKVSYGLYSRPIQMAFTLIDFNLRIVPLPITIIIHHNGIRS